MDINGYMARKVWRVHGASTDQSDTGYLSGRSLSITKYKSATHLRVGYSENMRTWIMGSGTKIMEDNGVGHFLQLIEFSGTESTRGKIGNDLNIACQLRSPTPEYPENIIIQGPIVTSIGRWLKNA